MNLTHFPTQAPKPKGKKKPIIAVAILTHHQGHLQLWHRFCGPVNHLVQVDITDG